MKYQHHWRTIKPPDHQNEINSWQNVAADALEIVDACAMGGIVLAGVGGIAQPEIGGGRIALNGHTEWMGDHEGFTFDLGRYTPEDVDTERRSYDVAVTSILLRAIHHYGGRCLVASDGDWAGAWAPARTLCASLFNAAYDENTSLLVPLATVLGTSV